MTTSVLDAALEYADQGFSVIPVRRADKKPYVKWEEFTKRRATTDEIERWWQLWPDANVAIITGAISGIWAVDADGPKGVDYVAEHYPKTSVYSITSKGFHGIYLVPDGKVVKTAVRIAPGVDIRGEGGYIVVPPSRHASGHEYRWRFLLDGWDDLTAYEPSSNGHKTGNLNIDLSSVKTSPINEPVAQGQRNDTLARLAGKWIAQGLDEPEVIALAKAWNSNNSPPLGEKELLSTIRSISKTHMRHNPPPTCELTPETSTPASFNEVPDNILHPGGILEQMINYIERNSTVSVPIFSLAASVTCLGNVIGQKVQTETGLRTNIYSIALGYSGAGKNAPFSCLPQLLARTHASRTLGPTELTSSSAILRWLSLDGQHVAILFLDEIGLVLKGLKNPNSAACEIPRLLIKLFSGTNRSEIKNYASGDTIHIPWHHLAFYGASTPERFWESLSPGEVSDGFLARVLIWESHIEAPFPKAVISFQADPSLEHQLNELAGMRTDMDSSAGNLVPMPIPKIVPRSEAAQEIFAPWSQRYHHLKNEHRCDQSGVASIYGRAAEHAAKLALVHAASLDGVAVKRVGQESIRWACGVMDFLVANLVSQITENIAENDLVRWQQKIIKGIRFINSQNGGLGASFRDLQRGPCRGILKADVQKILETMMLAETIMATETKVEGAGRPVVKYHVAQSAE